MAIRAYDRVAGLRVDLPDGELLASRYQLLPDQGGLRHNSMPVRRGTFVVPDVDGRWAVLGDGESAAGAMDRVQLPDPRSDARGLIMLGRQIDDELAAGADWDDLVAISPVEPDMSERAALLQFERRLSVSVGYLEDVCTRPRVKLSVETERVPLSLARRTARNAPNFLASHAEDWERRTLRSVMPRRILALVRRDEYDIYENRVAVRLVDRLSSYLTRRIREVHELARVFEEAQDFNSDAGKGTFRRRHRLFELWGSATDAGRALEVARHTITALENLRRRINTLKDSLLYRQVPRRADLGVALHVTNVLADDPRYRRVAELWRDWAQNARDEVLKPAERFEQWQELNRLFNRFALLVAVRALDQLGYRAVSGLGLIDHKDLDLHRGGSVLRFRWNRETGTVEVYDGSTRLLRLVPVCSYLPTLGAASLEAALQAADRSKATLFVYPTPPSSLTDQVDPVPGRPRLQTLAHELPSRDGHRAGFAPISPRDIGSIERIARHVRWVTLSPVLDAYPCRIERVAMPDDLDVSSWAERKAGNLVIRALPPRDAIERLRGAARRASAAMDGLLRERDELADEISRAQRAGRSAREAAHRKHIVDEAIPAAEAMSSGLVALVDGLGAAMPALHALATCPICGEQDSSSFHWRDARRFDARCARCEARWSLNRCSGCEGWVPVLVPHYKLEELGVDLPSEGWVDRMFGADVLAAPRLVRGSLRFACPTCGAVGA